MAKLQNTQGYLAEDEFDIAGAATGAVDADKLLSAELVKAGDVLIGMPASGFHANGYSLIRHIIKTKNLSLDSKFPDTDMTLGELLLTPTEIYTLDCLALIKSLGTNLRTFVHVTGGGLAENTARVIPAGLCATYDRSTWALPVEMEFMARMLAMSAQPALERTWNAGVGMVAVVAPEVADLTLRSLAARGMKAWIAGEVRSNEASARSTLEGTYQAR